MKRRKRTRAIQKDIDKRLRVMRDEDRLSKGRRRRLT